MNKKTVLMILVDGMRHDYINSVDSPFLYALGKQNIEAVVRETFAFELRPAFFAGLQPEECDIANMFCYDPENSPFRNINVSHGDRAKITNDLKIEAEKRGYSLVKHVGSCFDIPPHLLRYFDFSEKYHTVNPGAIPNYRTLFDYLREDGKKWLWIAYPDGPAHTKGVLDQFLAEVTGNEDFIYLHFSELDWVGHEFGPHSPEQKKSLREIDESIKAVYSKLNQSFSEVQSIVFGDHGQVGIKEHFDIESKLKETGLVLEKDYLYFLDSTQARFWFFNNTAKKKVINLLSNIQEGKLLSEADYERLHIRFKHNKFWELIFVTNDGVGLFPNFFQHRNPCKGLHGYLPEVEGNWAKLIITGVGVNSKISNPVKMVSLFPTILEMMGYKKPSSMQIQSIFEREHISLATEKYAASIVMPTYNRLTTLKKCLSAIEKQSYPKENFELILVNDGSTDGTDSFLKEYQKDTKLNFKYSNQQNAGPAAARNAGIKNTEGHVIILIGDDMIMEPAFIKKHIDFHQQWPQLSHACLGFIDWSQDIEISPLMDLITSKDGGQQFCWHIIEGQNPDNIDCSFFWSSNISFKRNFSLTHGLFNADLFKHAMWEDVELGNRLSGAGLILHFRKEFKVLHEHRITFEDFAKRQRMVGWYNHDLLAMGIQAGYLISDVERSRIYSDKIFEFISGILSKSTVETKCNNHDNLKEIYNYGLRYAGLTGYVERENGLAEDVEGGLGLILNLSRAERQLVERDQELAERDQELAKQIQLLSEKDTYISNIHSSNAWKVLKRYYWIRDKLTAEGALKKRYSELFNKLRDRSTYMPSNRILWEAFYRLRDSIMPKGTKRRNRAKSILMKYYRIRDRFSFLTRWAEKTDSNIADPVTVSENGSDYVPLIKEDAVDTTIKLIAFYLPQFHPIPENDQWWGKGFTEWTNVTSATPQFVGHYQPRLPGELGFYDLRIPEIMERQVELARLYGLRAFCFYYYWFGGKKLLDMPLNQFLSNKKLDLGFCLCWANENWTRRWDGYDQDILISQKHSPEDDLSFIKELAPMFKDERYVRVDGKPLLIVYRPSLLPNPKATAKRWRDYCHTNGIGEIYLAMTFSFDRMDPSAIGFNAAIEFPPNNEPAPQVSKKMEMLPPDFKGIIYDYRYFVEASRNYKKPDYTLYRSVNPSWDNEARRPGRGSIYALSSPALYKEWLSNACRYTEKTLDKENRLIFINAWNEWAEGAYLEPDQRYGYAWLQATRDALVQESNLKSQRKIVVVSHDAHPHGAQYLSLHLVKALSSDFGFQVDVVLLGDGALTPEFSLWATVHNLSGYDPQGDKAAALASNLASSGYQAAIVNTTVSGLFLKTLSDAGLRCVALIHELRGIIDSHGLHNHAEVIAKRADTVVFAAPQVAESFAEVAHIPNDRLKIRTQGLYKRNAFRWNIEGARTNLRKELGLSENAQIILCVGYADQRKGTDLFIEIGLRVIKTHPHAYFVWVGHWEKTMQALVKKRLSGTKLADRFLFVGRKNDTDMYYSGSDVFALTSREDPFPSVVMESLEVSVPVVGFDEAGGFTILLKKGCGLLVPKDDVAGFADAVVELLNDPDKAKELGEFGKELVQQAFSLRHYIFDLLDWAGLSVKRVTAVVPNYNYARYLEQRLSSIISQTYPLFEIIVLDDASTDNSLEVINNCLAKTEINHSLIINQENSGSVFEQWQKGIDLARGDYIWICETDDFADPFFVERAMKMFNNEQVAISYTQSRQVDEHGNVLSNNYLDYVRDVNAQKWLKDYVCDGKEELLSSLSIKNTIPNVSAVIFRKLSLREALEHSREDLKKLKIAGDWLIYSNILRYGHIGFVAESLNSHRRHQSSVTLGLGSSNASHIAEIIFMQKKIANLTQLSNPVSRKAQEYIKHVCEYLGVTTINGLDPAEEPEISRWLEKISWSHGEETTRKAP